MTDGRWMLFVACAGVTAELLSWLAFPVTTALSQHQNPAALRIASLTGVWGVSFLLWYAQAAAVAVFSKPKTALAVAAGVALVMGAACWIPRAPNGSLSVPVAAVQANSGYAPEFTAPIPPGTLVVWPEFLMQDGDRTPEVAARSSRVYLAASFLDPARPKPHNACRLVSPSGKSLAVFRKQHLFGRETMDFSRGEPSRPVLCEGVRVGVAICYDTEFADVVRRLARDGAQVVLVPNHDPEMPNHLFNHLHAAVIPFRAAENGIPIVWAESRALSMVLAPDGRIIAQAEPGKSEVVKAEVPVRRGTTIYTRVGDVFAYLCAVGMVVLLIFARGTAAPSARRRSTWRP
jgi:apolipoprotein N-acyltransferase